MKNLIEKILTFFWSKTLIIKSNLFFLIIWTLLLFLPDVLFLDNIVKELYNNIYYCVRSFLFHFGAVFLLCYILSLIEYKLPAIIKYVKIFITIIFSILSIVDVFLNSSFKMRVGFDTIRLLLQTNSSESSEFLYQYVLSYKVLLILFIYLLSFLLVYKLCKLLARKKLYLFQKFIILVVIFLGIISFFLNVKFYFNQKILYDTYSVPTYFKKTIFAQLKLANIKIGLCRSYIPKCIKILENMEDVKCFPKTKNIVLCLGESFIKKHSSLYGYNLNTNPLLSNYER